MNRDAIKRQMAEAMATHASQIGPEDFFMVLPDEAFASAFGIEWFVAPDRPRGSGSFGDDLFVG
jgi:hypothetical protein